MSFSCSHAGPSDLGGGAPTQGAAGPAGLSAGAIIYQGKKGYKMVRQYLMGDLLGEGAQGKVKEAVDSESLRRVAIKIINLRQLRKVRNAEEMLMDTERTFCGEKVPAERTPSGRSNSAIDRSLFFSSALQ